MKHFLAFLLAATMMLVFVSCGNTHDPVDTTGGGSSQTTEDTKASEDTSAPEETTAPKPEEPENLDGALSEIIDRIYEVKPSGLMVWTSELDLSDADSVKRQTGIEDASKVKEIYLSEAMRSQAYSMVLVRVADSTDVKALAEEMRDGIDQRKWICAYADDLRVAAYGDVIMLIMVDSSFDGISTDEIVEAFRTVCGGELDLVLKK